MKVAGRYYPAPMIETIIKIRDGRPDSRYISPRRGNTWFPS
jgi:hypothetical protein